ncbi:uncharacterized protein LOC133355887 [Lethenteron reissneri]|uniref:uncharacterized protein LOC133355887 n=1 Tax=Lethenteron reissneri TaxID=7753 RepID=UPI002AB6D4E8|nr:uncharacterized protein LOC133355887 [Lethenteron reissneri]
MDSARCRLAKRGDLAAASPSQRLVHSCRSKRSAVGGSSQEDGTDGRDLHHLHNHHHHLHHHLHHLQQQQHHQSSHPAPRESLDVVRPGAPCLDVAGLLACAGCSGRVRPPIRQCPRGHLACTPCTVAAGPSPRCPACWGPAAAARNLALERLALMCGVAT